MALMMSSIRDCATSNQYYFLQFATCVLYLAGPCRRTRKVWDSMGRTIGGHVKCSVRSMFSCCFAFAILLYILEWLSGNAAKSTCAVATRLGRVYLRPGSYWIAASARTSGHLALFLPR
jgi:hypothetical protein